MYNNYMLNAACGGWEDAIPHQARNPDYQFGIKSWILAFPPEADPPLADAGMTIIELCNLQ
ncbi:MAG: hypothetical protein AAB863_02740 [Patescibacteria group bacterium]